MAGLLDKLIQMQTEMKRVQDELAEERYTISVGGDAVQVVIDGQQRVHHVIFSPEALAAGQQDREMLQDLRGGRRQQRAGALADAGGRAASGALRRLGLPGLAGLPSGR